MRKSTDSDNTSSERMVPVPPPGGLKNYVIWCKACKDIKAHGNNDHVMVFGERYVPKNKMAHCTKCNGKLTKVWAPSPEYDECHRLHKHRFEKQSATDGDEICH